MSRLISFALAYLYCEVHEASKNYTLKKVLPIVGLEPVTVVERLIPLSRMYPGKTTIVKYPTLLINYIAV